MKFIALIILGVTFCFQADSQPNPVPKDKHRFIVIAHRGDHVIYPENTLQAYEQAIKNGADYMEIDLRTTSDGKLVSMHDASVNRMTDGKGLVKDMTLEQIANLRVTAKNKQDTTIYHVPTFEQILKVSRHKIHIYIDFKEAGALETFTLLKQFHMEKQVLVYINKPTQFADWRNIAPHMPLMISLPDNVKNADALRKFVDQYHPDVLDGNYSDYDSQMVVAANEMKIPVWPDAQGPHENVEVWDKAIALGLQGLQTDNPPALVQYLKQRLLR